jgi:hypothetical protein
VVRAYRAFMLSSTVNTNPGGRVWPWGVAVAWCSS